MTKHFCCCFSLKTGALVMSFLNLFEGSIEITAGIVKSSNLTLAKNFDNLMKKWELCETMKLGNCTTPEETSGVTGTTTLFICCFILGLFTIFNGVLLLVGIIQAKEKYILLYVLLGSVALLTVIIYTGQFMFHGILIFALFILSIFMGYGQLAVYYFYEEVAEYNTVKSGVIEIAFNGDAKSYANSGITPENTIDNTAV